MIVGSMRLSLVVHGSRSLKEKRGPKQKLCGRIRSRFKVAVAEVDTQDSWDQLTLGIATVGPDREPIARTLQSVADFVEASGIAELVGEEVEFFRPELG